MFTQRLRPRLCSQVLLMPLHTELAGLATCHALHGIMCWSYLASEPSAAYSCSHRVCIHGSVARYCMLVCVSQTWPQSQMLPVNFHTELAVGPNGSDLQGTACLHVWVRPCLMVRPGLRARCCLYMITQSLQCARMAPTCKGLHACM